MKNQSLLVAALLVSFSFVVPASAQMLLRAETAASQAQIGRDAEGYSTCGIRTTAFVALDKGNAEIYDFSLNVYRDHFFGMLKAGKTFATAKQVLNQDLSAKAVTPRPIRFWISAANDDKPLISTKVTDSETKGYMIAGGDFVLTFQNIYAVMYGEQMQFVTRYAKEKLDVVISFKAPLPKDEQDALVSCLDGIRKRLEDSIKDEVISQ